MNAEPQTMPTTAQPHGEARRPHKTLRCSTGPLRALMEEMGISAAEMSRRLFQSDQTVSDWIKKDDMPQWATLAVECFKRRLAGSEATIWLVRPGKKAAAAKTVLEVIGVAVTEIVP